MQSKLADKLERRPFWAADLIGVDPDTIFRWIAFLRGAYKGYRPCRARRAQRQRISDKLDIPLADVDVAFNEPGRNGDE
jgi:hypothetical protein